MSDYEDFKAVFRRHGGLMKASEFVNAGFHHKNLEKLMNEKLVRRIKRGFYEWQTEFVSDVAILAKMFPDAVIYLNSALYLYEYIDRTPMEWHLAVSRESGRSRFNIVYPRVKPYYISEKYMDIGLTKVSFEGCDINIFDKERTICDLIKYMKKIDRELLNQALKAYLNDPEKNISNLILYSKKLRVYTKIKNIIGLWL